MYIPPKYRNEDPVAIRSFVERHAFGILVSPGEPTPMATHLPLELADAEIAPQPVVTAVAVERHLRRLWLEQ